MFAPVGLLLLLALLPKFVPEEHLKSLTAVWLVTTVFLSLVLGNFEWTVLFFPFYC